MDDADGGEPLGACSASVKWRYFSMFSGIGGFELGIQRANPKATCIGYSEVDKYAITTYERHLDHDNYGDATKIDPGQLPDFDLLVGGFPCQAFSVAGKRQGFDEARGTLFFDIARILRDKAPRHLVLENVKGLLSHDAGRTFQVILGVLTDLGYCVEWQVLNSKDFGVPQNRERVYIVGHLGGGCSGQVFPIPGAHRITGEEHVGRSPIVGVVNRGEFRNTGDRVLTLTSSYHKGPDNHGQNPAVVTGINWPSRGPEPRKDGLASTLRAGESGTKNRVLVREATTKGYAEAVPGDSINFSQPNSRTRRGRIGHGVANTLETSLTQATLTSDLRIRRLTPRECERLQGFPDDWTAGVSDTQRYKQCGNAVTVNVVEAVMRGLVSHG